MDTTLILVGVACIVGAIVGGGVKLVQVEMRAVDSVWRQLLLGVFGAVLVVSGLVLKEGVAPGPGEDVAKPLVEQTPVPVDKPEREPEPEPLPVPAPIETQKPVEPPTLPPGPERPSVSPPANFALPAKVDIFWCVSGGDANGTAAKQIGDTLRTAGEIAQVRVRALSVTTNARPDYGIDANIVRYDPGERGAATRLAALASDAAGVAFAPAPALPGTPSVGYLSIFACAAG